jgi:hypothetical protein
MSGLLLRKCLWIALVLSVLGLCFFSDGRPAKSSQVLGPVLAEITAVLADPGTQWMVFVWAGIYFLAFVILRMRLAGRRRMGTRCNASLPGEVWLSGLLAVAALAYAFDYAQAVRSTQALTLIGAAMIGKGAGLWEGRRKKEECRKGGGGSLKSKVQSLKSPGGTVVGVFIILLTGAAVWQAEPGRLFQYRGQGRWTGPWDNPNTFGMLMGVGLILAVGRLVQSRMNADCGVRSAECDAKAEGRMKNAEGGGERPTSNIQHRTSNWGLWVRAGLFGVAAGVMGVGLVKSYSRGAWVGTAVACIYLGWQAGRFSVIEAIDRGIREMRGKGASQAGVNAPVVPLLPRVLRIPRFMLGGGRLALATVVVSIGILGFWNLRHFEGPIARRAVSVANANDFSWRNRVAAWDGALQMMAERPWFGFGWNQPERVYDQFYRPSRVPEGAAIQLNDYLILGTTLGIPALACFVLYVLLAFIPQPAPEPAPPPSASPGPEFRTPHSAFRTQLTLDYSAVCRAAAVVLLVAFWFDGGLFKLATAAPFWILLELGRAGDHEIHEAHENA